MIYKKCFSINIKRRYSNLFSFAVCLSTIVAIERINTLYSHDYLLCKHYTLILSTWAFGLLDVLFK